MAQAMPEVTESLMSKDCLGPHTYKYHLHLISKTFPVPLFRRKVDSNADNVTYINGYFAGALFLTCT